MMKIEEVMTDSELIKNHTIFFAYLCHLIKTDQVDSAEKLCDIGFKLDEEINKRKITEIQIEECINNSNLEPQDQLIVSKYIYPELGYLISKIGNS